VEAGTSDVVKDLLQHADAQDTDIVPAGDMFELGSKVQVFKKGLLFPARAKKLYELYRQFDSLEQIDAQTCTQLQTRYFKRSFAEVYEETKNYYLRFMPEVIERAERDPKHKMALIFRWYFVRTNRLALRGDQENKVDYQIHCGPALGAFNQWVKGTPLEDWRKRHVDDIAERLMAGAADFLDRRVRQLASTESDQEHQEHLAGAEIHVAG
jgi:trans-AT polyketide synthase/acyltransferase/oxidoreductase domain-containing protein